MIDIQKDISLASYTSWLVGGSAEYFFLPKTVAELQEAQAWALAKKMNIAVVGGGSNVLISDQGIAGLTMCLKFLNKVETLEENGNFKVIAESGTGKSELLKIYLKNKLPPALFLAGLPGDVGGGVVMNAGVAEAFKPREFVEITDWVEVLRPNGKIAKLKASELAWKYRHCEGWQPGIITRVGFTWPKEIDEKILEKVREANKVRLSKQPLDMPSCGSVFKNPEGHKAAQLIDSCGLKGFSIGGAQVSTKHANFIVNTGNATASDTWAVMEHVRITVKEQRQIELSTEVVRLGRWT
jgi:UDP-N-acetylmuramate dehydrogenase